MKEITPTTETRCERNRTNKALIDIHWGGSKKFFFLENTLSPPKIVRLAEKTPQKKIRFDSSNIRHGNRVFVFSSKSGDSPNLNE